MTQDEPTLRLRPDGSIDCEFYIQRSRERWSKPIDALRPLTSDATRPIETAPERAPDGRHATSRDMIGTVLVAVGFWVVFAAGPMGWIDLTPRGHAWVVTASEKMSSRPSLVRATLPSVSQPRVAMAQ
jgi:hypothetical protein